jgi:hypothetical protein
MKKLMTVSTWGYSVAQFTKMTLVLLVGAGLGIGFWSVTAIAQSSNPTTSSKPSPTPKPPKPSPTPKPPKPTPTPKPGKCIICDHDKNKDTNQQIDCDKVDEYLQKHPQDSRGPCQPTPVTNP